MRTRQRARLRSPGQLWGRRTIFTGLAVIATAILGGLILLLNDDDGGGQAGTGDEASVQLPELGESLDDPGSGISVRWPSDWRELEKGAAFAFQSPDKTVAVTISAPAGADDADQLRRDAIDSTAAEYEQPVVRPGKGRTIGGLQAAGATISGKGPLGQSATLVAIAAGKQKAYLFVVLSAEGAPSERLVEAQLILNSLELSK